MIGQATHSLLADNVVVPQGKTLTIGEGTVLLFKPFTGLVIEGSLTVAGSLEKPVVFTSENDAKYNPAPKQLANPFDWNGIYITQKAQLVKLSNFMLEYSVYGVKSLKEEFVISNGTFTHNGQFHVTVNDSIKNVSDNIPFNFGKKYEKKFNAKSKSGNKTTWRKQVGIGLRVMGLAAIGAGGYFYNESKNYDSKYSSASTQNQMDDNWDKKSSSLTIAGTSVFGGCVLAACGVTFYLWKPSAKSSKKITVSPILGIDNGISIRFKLLMKLVMLIKQLNAIKRYFMA